MHHVLSMWTVYDHPSDYPRGFVARRFEIGKGEAAPTDDVIEASNLETLRDVLAMRGLTAIERHPDDDKNIIEVWL